MQIKRLDNKCNNCMRCARECVAGVWRDVGGVPTPVAPELCNLCSHCLAVCPVDAIEHSGLDSSDVRAIKKKLIASDGYREVVMGRRSIRQYRNKPVPREVIEEILDLARYSPTASNTQNVAYTIVTDSTLLRRVSKRIFNMGVRTDKVLKGRPGKYLLKAFEKTGVGQTISRYMSMFDYYKEQSESGRDYILHNAPALILIHAPRKANFACDNCNIAATNIANYAYSLGLGACFIGFITMTLRYDRALKKILNIPAGHKVFASLIIGYPAYPYTNSPARKKPDVQWV